MYLRAEDLYVAAYPRLVRILTAAAGDSQEAEDVVQEAFVRLLSRWRRVSSYDDPEAWVRLVAFRLLSNRARRARLKLASAGQAGSASSAATDAVHASVDMSRALAALPPVQRHAVVLHHVLGLSVEEVATTLRIPVGTVKSRLSRGRRALAPLLVSQEEVA